MTFVKILLLGRERLIDDSLYTPALLEALRKINGADLSVVPGAVPVELSQEEADAVWKVTDGDFVLKS